MASPAGCPASSSIQRSLPDKYALQKAKAHKAAEHASPPLGARRGELTGTTNTSRDPCESNSNPPRELLKTLHVQPPQENCSERSGGD